MAEAEDFWELMESHFRLVDYMAGAMRMKEDANKLLQQCRQTIILQQYFRDDTKVLSLGGLYLCGVLYNNLITKPYFSSSKAVLCSES